MFSDEDETDKDKPSNGSALVEIPLEVSACFLKLYLTVQYLLYEQYVGSSLDENQ